MCRLYTVECVLRVKLKTHFFHFILTPYFLHSHWIKDPTPNEQVAVIKDRSWLLFSHILFCDKQISLCSDPNVQSCSLLNQCSKLFLTDHF